MRIDVDIFDCRMARECLTIESVSKKSGVSRSTIEGIRRGREVRPSTVGLLARALRVDVEELIDKEA